MTHHLDTRAWMARAERAEADVLRLQIEVSNRNEQALTVKNLHAVIETISAENERLRAALEWYADDGNWAGLQHPMKSLGVCIRSAEAHIDAGKRARDALQAPERSEGC